MITMSVPQYRRRQCTIDGRTVRLWPMWTEALAILLVSGPDRFVTRETLIEGIWPNPDFEPDYAQGILEHTLMALRRQGVPIENDWGFGWRIPRHARGQMTEMRRAA